MYQHLRPFMFQLLESVKVIHDISNKESGHYLVISIIYDNT